jgi:hypothetical protein
MKRNNLLALILTGALAVSMFACKKKETAETTNKDGISTTTLSQISAMGFSTENARKVDGGYLVEGDIVLTDDNLSKKSNTPNLSIAETEQYRTTNLVKNLPRAITISVTNLPQVYSDAVDLMITRYNAQGLGLTFQRASTGTVGNIDVFGFNEGPSGGYITLGSSGFPTSAGEPFNQVKMNTNVNAYGTNPNLLYVASVLQHEVGHCIGFRHTDYMNRAYSCGGKRANEGTAGIGAVQIPGTPSKADAESFMLACSNGGDRTFNANDLIALKYLYK